METNIYELAKMHIPNKYGILPKVNMARCAWNSLRGNLHEWTPEVANSLKHGPLYEIKYFLSRLPYTTKLVNMNWSEEVLESFGFVKAKIKNKVTQDHYIGSYTVGECALDNPDVYLVDGTLERFTKELYPYVFLVNYVTQPENKKLSNLKGKCLTIDKYKVAGIKIYNEYREECENPPMPEIFTEWENEKYFGSDLSRFM